MQEFTSGGTDPVVDVVANIEMPILNAEFAIQSYLLANGRRLDAETRTLLAGVRDCLHRVTDTTRTVTRRQKISI